MVHPIAPGDAKTAPTFSCIALGGLALEGIADGAKGEVGQEGVQAGREAPEDGLGGGAGVLGQTGGVGPVAEGALGPGQDDRGERGRGGGSVQGGPGDDDGRTGQKRGTTYVLGLSARAGSRPGLSRLPGTRPEHTCDPRQRCHSRPELRPERPIRGR